MNEKAINTAKDITEWIAALHELSEKSLVGEGADELMGDVADELDADALAQMEHEPIGHLCQDAFWYLMEGDASEIGRAHEVFRVLAEESREIRERARDRFIRYGAPVRGEELVALNEAMAEVESLPSAERGGGR